MKKLLFILLLLSACGPKQYLPTPTVFKKASSTIYGLDVLGIAIQDIKIIKNQLKQGMAIQALEGTFGDAIPPLKECLSTGKLSVWLLHLADGTCIRNNTCRSGAIKYSDYQSLQKRAIAAEKLHQLYPTVRCYLSPFLEHDSKDKNQVNRWFQTIKDFAPSCIPMVSAFTGYKPAGVLVQNHGNTATGAIISNDGENYQDSNIDRYKSGASLIALAWWPRLNGRVSGEKGVPPPPKLRKPKAKKYEVQQAVHTLLNTMSPMPIIAGCPGLKPPQLLKINAEDYDTTDPRENKPLLITKENLAKGWGIWKIGGEKIACANFYGPYSGGGYRYYVGSCSGESAYDLFKEAGSEWVLFKNGRTCYTVNIIRRQPTYR